MDKKNNIETALVVQGGSLRSVFTAGIFDAFLSHGYNPFDFIVGVSSGSMCASYYFSEQYKAVYYLMKALVQDPNFISFKNIFSEEGYMNLAYMEEFSQQERPFDTETAVQKLNAGKQFEIVTTDIHKGVPVYHQPTLESWMTLMRASSTLPYVTRGVCKFEGKELMDGGWTDPIPIKRAIEMGAKKILVIRTQPTDYRQTWSYMDVLGSYFHRDNPTRSKVLANNFEFYNETCDFLEEEQEGIHMVQLYPEEFLKTHKNPTSLISLKHDYQQGLETAIDYLRSVNRIEKEA